MRSYEDLRKYLLCPKCGGSIRKDIIYFSAGFRSYSDHLSRECTDCGHTVQFETKEDYEKRKE